MEKLLKDLKERFPKEKMEIKQNQVGLDQIIINDKINISNIYSVYEKFEDHLSKKEMLNIVSDFIEKELSN